MNFKKFLGRIIVRINMNDEVSYNSDRNAKRCETSKIVSKFIHKKARGVDCWRYNTDIMCFRGYLILAVVCSNEGIERCGI